MRPNPLRALYLATYWTMSLEELESAVAKLTPQELTRFSKWFATFAADAWDRQIDDDVRAGRLEEAGDQADKRFESGDCSPLLI